VLTVETGLKQLVSCNVKQFDSRYKNWYKCSFSLHETDYFKPASSKCGPPEAARIQHVTFAYYCVFGGRKKSATEILHIKRKTYITPQKPAVHTDPISGPVSHRTVNAVRENNHCWL